VTEVGTVRRVVSLSSSLPEDRVSSEEEEEDEVSEPLPLEQLLSSELESESVDEELELSELDEISRVGVCVAGGASGPMVRAADIGLGKRMRQLCD
jgi:hypothetical protein